MKRNFAALPERTLNASFEVSRQIMEELIHRRFGAERALYGSEHLLLRDCTFDGPEDGESALKESSDITAEHCFFNLRYPFWHDHGLRISNCKLSPLCRAALWYSGRIKIESTELLGIKALRECEDVCLKGCTVRSPEFGWSVRGVQMENCDAESEYFMLRSTNLTFKNVTLKGKYSFQYIENSTFENCVFDTKDAFWHAKNVTLTDCVLKGEYLSWYSDGLTLIRCKISGTQPLCYCKNLRLTDCEMTDADLCFEKSDIEATLTAPAVSIKNPHSGSITLPALGEAIFDDPEAKGKIHRLNQNK